MYQTLQGLEVMWEAPSDPLDYRLSYTLPPGTLPDAALIAFKKHLAQSLEMLQEVINLDVSLEDVGPEEGLTLKPFEVKGSASGDSWTLDYHYSKGGLEYLVKPQSQFSLALTFPGDTLMEAQKTAHFSLKGFKCQLEDFLETPITVEDIGAPLTVPVKPETDLSIVQAYFILGVVLVMTILVILLMTSP